MKLLLHICCAPCSIMCIETLRGEGIEPVGFWDNPNIHPFTEFRMRRNTLVDYAKEIGLSLVVEGGRLSVAADPLAIAGLYQRPSKIRPQFVRADCFQSVHLRRHKRRQGLARRRLRGTNKASGQYQSVSKKRYYC